MQQHKKINIFCWFPLAIILLGVFCFFYFNLTIYFSLDTLDVLHSRLFTLIQQHYFLTVSIFMLVYIIAIALSMPVNLILTLTGGLLFGLVFGTIYVLFSATVGAMLNFLAVRISLGTWLTHNSSGWMKKIQQEFQQSAFNYVLALRLIPGIPFWLVNILPALMHVRLRAFVIATFLGIIPATILYVLVGNSLGILFSIGVPPDLHVIFRPFFFYPLLVLAVLALIPVGYKKIIKHKNGKHIAR